MLKEFSQDIANLIEARAPSVVQVEGQRRPATGLAYGRDLVLTTSGAIGREERPRVRRADGTAFEAELTGWDPATRLVLLKAPGLDAPTLTPGALPRVGEIAIAIARSWSNAVTATIGLVSVIGGPLHTGRRRSIERVIRTSAPMHDGFAGGALVGADGAFLGVTTAASIRGLGVVIPADIAWAAAAGMKAQGTIKRGYIGIAAQVVSVPEKQRAEAAAEALLVVSVKEGSPAAEAGLLVGDLIVSLDDQPLSSPEELLDLLTGDRVGRSVLLRVLRGGRPIDVRVNVVERS